MNWGRLHNAEVAASVAVKRLEAEVIGFVEGTTPTEADYRSACDLARKLIGTLEDVRRLRGPTPPHQPTRTIPNNIPNRAHAVAVAYLERRA